MFLKKKKKTYRYAVPMLAGSVVIVESRVVPVIKFRVLYFIATSIDFHALHDVILWHFVHERTGPESDKKNFYWY